MDTERAELATASFHADPRSQGRVHVHHMDANDFQSRNRFDLLVIDPQTGAIELGYEALLPRLSRLLSKRGGAILYTIYDLAAAYEGPNPPNGREEQEAFMLRYFGATALSLESLQKRMAREGFAALALTDRQMSQGGRAGHGWAYLQRPPTTER